MYIYCSINIFACVWIVELSKGSRRNMTNCECDEFHRGLCLLIFAEQNEQQNLLSTVAEWAMSFTLVVFFATLIPEFKRVQLQLPVVKHLDAVVT